MLFFSLVQERKQALRWYQFCLGISLYLSDKLLYWVVRPINNFHDFFLNFPLRPVIMLPILEAEQAVVFLRMIHA